MVAFAVKPTRMSGVNPLNILSLLAYDAAGARTEASRIAVERGVPDFRVGYIKRTQSFVGSNPNLRLWKVQIVPGSNEWPKVNSRASAREVGRRLGLRKGTE